MGIDVIPTHHLLADSLGGNLFWSAGLSLISDIPRKPHWPVKTHLFLNAGRLDVTDKSASSLNSSWVPLTVSISTPITRQRDLEYIETVDLGRSWPRVQTGSRPCRGQLRRAAHCKQKRRSAEGFPGWDRT